MGQDFAGLVEDLGVIEVNDAAVGTWFDVQAYGFASFKVCPPKVVANCLYREVELISDLVDAAVGQAVFDLPKLIEG